MLSGLFFQSLFSLKNLILLSVHALLTTLDPGLYSCFEEGCAWLVGTHKPAAVFLDHANLRYFMKSQLLTPRQVCWSSYLSSSYFIILHTPGKVNPADPPSFRPDYEAGLPSSAHVNLLTPPHSRDGLSVCLLRTSVSSVDFSFSLPSPGVYEL